MRHDGDGDGEDRIAGLPTAEAVETVVDADDSLDEESVRRILEPVTADGVVSRDAAEDAIAHAAKVVSTPETRLELATNALEEARDAAEPVDDLGAVRSRLSAFASRLSAIEDRVEVLGTDLQNLVGQDLDEASLFDVAREIGRIEDEANDRQYAADELAADVESFERWLGDPSVRREELAADVDAVADSLSQIEDTVETVEALDDGTADGHSEGDGDGRADGLPEGEDDADPAASWVEASIGHRVSGLLLADVRAELADLRTMADRLDEAGTDELGGADEPDDVATPDDEAGADGADDVPSAADLDARLADLEARRSSLGDRLDALGRPAWHRRFEDRLSSVDRILATDEPPVDWGALQAALDERQ